ncbi:MAG: hypothetical protein V3R99_01240 [Thermoguttaceae bacterium]
MRTHRFITHLLTIVLLGCPLLCFSNSCESDAYASVPQAAGCGCCHAADSDAPPNDGKESDESGPGMNCLCHGAVVAVRAHGAAVDSPSDWEALVEDGVPLAILPVETLASGTSGPRRSVAIPFGRDLCALIGAFLL